MSPAPAIQVVIDQIHASRIEFCHCSDNVPGPCIGILIALLVQVEVWDICWQRAFDAAGARRAWTACRTPRVGACTGDSLVHAKEGVWCMH